MDDRQTDRIQCALQRIANTLSLPITAFDDTQDDVRWDGGPASGEVQTLFRAFLSLRDPAARKRAIAAVESEQHVYFGLE